MQTTETAAPIRVQWSNHGLNLLNLFGDLLVDQKFVDVTLACDNRSIKCHKLVLSACSSYLEELLSTNPCSHPIIFLKDMKFTELESLIEFMYKGETDIDERSLQVFIHAAKSLQIRGIDSLPPATEDEIAIEIQTPEKVPEVRNVSSVKVPPVQTKVTPIETKSSPVHVKPTAVPETPPSKKRKNVVSTPEVAASRPTRAKRQKDCPVPAKRSLKPEKKTPEKKTPEKKTPEKNVTEIKLELEEDNEPSDEVDNSRALIVSEGNEEGSLTQNEVRNGIRTQQKSLKVCLDRLQPNNAKEGQYVLVKCEEKKFVGVVDNVDEAGVHVKYMKFNIGGSYFYWPPEEEIENSCWSQESILKILEAPSVDRRQRYKFDGLSF